MADTLPILVTGPDGEATHHLAFWGPAPCWGLVGRRADCDIVLDHPDVAPVHARLSAMSHHRFVIALAPVRSPEGAVLRPLGGGDPAVTPIRVDRHPFCVGPFTLQFEPG